MTFTGFYHPFHRQTMKILKITKITPFYIIKTDINYTDKNFEILNKIFPTTNTIEFKLHTINLTPHKITIGPVTINLKTNQHNKIEQQVIKTLNQTQITQNNQLNNNIYNQIIAELIQQQYINI